MKNFYIEESDRVERAVNICIQNSHDSYMEEQAAVEAGKMHLLIQIMKNTAVIADYISRINIESEE